MLKRYTITHVPLLCFLLFVAAGGYPAQAQEVMFEVDAVCMRIDASAQTTSLDLYTRIPYKQLAFINTPNGFTASYEVTAEIYKLDDRNRRENLVETSIWESSAVVSAYALTTSENSFDHTTNSVELEPGRYLVEVQLADKNAEKTFVTELPVEVRDLRGPIAISDIVLLKEFDEASKTIYPLVSENIGSDLPSIELFYELYANQPQRVRVVREVVPIRKRSSALIRTGRTLLGLSQPDEEAIPILFSDADVIELQRGRHQTITELPLADFLDVGDYMVRVRVENEQGQLLSMTERTFSAHWTGLMAHIRDLDEAIEQMEYIAKSKDLRELRQATSRSERLQKFQEFWKKYDPTPGTTRNERMEEYYHRIAYANQRYGSIVPGWKTDRGLVLVKFGEPDHIKRHPYSFDTEPYEVWTYERIGRYFIFIDKTGFGDYQLLRPIWDERNRIR